RETKRGGSLPPTGSAAPFRRKERSPLWHSYPSPLHALNPHMTSPLNRPCSARSSPLLTGGAPTNFLVRSSNSRPPPPGIGLLMRLFSITRPLSRTPTNRWTRSPCLPGHPNQGGAPYLHTLVEQAAVGATVGHYARIIAEKAVLRRLIQAGTRITQFGQQATPGADVDDLVERARDEVDSIVRTGSAHDPEVTTLADGLAGFLDRLERGDAVADVIPVPYADLADKLVGGGFAPGQLVVIAGRPGHGKTTIALDIMRHAAKRGKRVLFHSL